MDTQAVDHSWRRFFAPPPKLSFPYMRFCKVAARTIHLMAISVLVGGHAFHAPAGALKPLLYVAITTGACLIALETWPSLSFLFEGWGLLLLSKLALLCMIPFVWSYRFPILLVVVVIASVGSHMPLRFRHYSFLYGKVLKR